MKLGVLYLKLSRLDPSSSPQSPPTRPHIDGSPSGAGAVSLQANKLSIPAASSRVPNESTLSFNQSLSNNKLVSNGPSNPPNVRQLPPVISPTGARSFAPPSDTKTDASFQPSTASVSPPADVRPSSITRKSYDTNPPAAPHQETCTCLGCLA